MLLREALLLFLLKGFVIVDSCIPITPIPVDVDLNGSLGIWYTYRSGPSPTATNFITFTNPMIVYQSIGYYGGTINKQAQSMEIQSRLPDATSCYYVYLQVNRTSCGLIEQNYWIVENGNPVVAGYEERVTLYSDANFIQILHKCVDPSCSGQNVLVHIRRKPSELSDEEIAAINSIVDITLAPYCLTHDDLRLVGGTGQSMVCPYEDRPLEYLETIQRIKEGTKTQCNLLRQQLG